MENQRRRFEKEKEDAYEYGGYSFAKEALNLLDNLERSKAVLENDEKLKETESCPICLENLENITKTITPCGHFLCGTCVNKIFKANNEKLNCPICRQKFECEELEIIQI